jgi:mono/diheme cytochrome c family protein
MAKRTTLLGLSLATLTVGGSATSAEKITYSNDILPILQENCIECHRPGGNNLGGMVAPMAFNTYAETRPWAKSMAKAVATRAMPPWDAAAEHDGEFIGERTMSDEDREKIINWVKSGASRGNPKDMPTPIVFPDQSGWTIGEPDAVLTMPDPYFVPDDLLDATKYFPDTVSAEEMPADRWIKTVEFKPGSEVVHHIIATPFGGIAPGNRPIEYRDGYSAKVVAGQKYVWNMHYHKEPGPGTGMFDQSSLGVVFYPEGYTPEHVLSTNPFGPMRFRIPAGDPDYSASTTYTFEQDALINSMMPHMHYRGKKVLYELTYPDGEKENLLNVPNYDFNWQTSYRFIEPKAVPAGTKVMITGWWDNSADNPANPDPTIDVTFGEATHEEMLFGWMSFTNANEDHTSTHKVSFMDNVESSDD